METPKLPLKIIPSGRSLGLKLLLVCAMILLMSVPLLFISIISFERSSRADDVTREVSQRYGGDQSVLGPMLVAPYISTTEVASDVINGKPTRNVTAGQYVVFAESGRVEISDLTTEQKSRSLYKVTTYQANAKFTASFNLPQDLGELDVGRKIDWSRAQILIGMSDVRGLRDDVFLIGGDGQRRPFEPALTANMSSYASRNVEYSKASFSSMPTMISSTQFQFMAADASDLMKARTFKVSATLPIKGAQKLSIAPFAKTTKASVAGDWPHPGFQGKYPPDASEITDTGFSANWSVPFLARGMAGRGPADTLGLGQFNQRAMGIDLVQMVNPYQKVNRALKYAIMFIGLVFLSYFLFEVMIGVRVHAAQYVLIGLAQSIFYLLLLALSEHLGFALSFLAAAGSTVLVTAGYAASVFGGRQYGVRAGAIFAGVYGLLYVLMQIEDFALLVGALTSFIAIAVTMYLTRNIDWYGAGDKGDKPNLL
ncbi:MAG: cell envelope integrity protein CreD [Robiginitomaculum sp.]